MTDGFHSKCRAAAIRLLPRLAAALVLGAAAFPAPVHAQSPDQFWNSAFPPSVKSGQGSRGGQTTRTSVSRPTAASAVPPAEPVERRDARRANVFLADFGSVARMMRTEPMANGELFNPQDLVAAHASLPLDSAVLVTETTHGRSLLVRIKDRTQRLTAGLELSPAALRYLSLADKDLDKVRVRVISVWVPTGEPLFWPRRQLARTAD